MKVTIWILRNKAEKMLTEKELGDSGETTGCWEPSQKMALVEAAERGLVSRDKGNRVWLQEQLLWTAGESILERGGRLV